MSGFVGFVEKTQEKDAIIRNMADLIRHRGPDGEGYFTNDSVALGFRRLEVQNIGGESEPLYNEDQSLVMVADGRIYNHEELREELTALGHVFKTGNDTEVLLHGYEEYGEGILLKVRGMFALVIYNLREEKIFAARDPFGIKPFYYYVDDNLLLFASEIKAFLAHPRFKKQFNAARMPDYLCFEYIPDSETLFKNVYKLLGGRTLYLDVNSLDFSIERYHHFEYNIDEKKSLEEWADLISEALAESVKLQAAAELEVGCFLSSGVDSSYVTKKRLDLGPVKAFSIGYAEEKYSELSYAKEYAAAMGADFHSQIIGDAETFAAVRDIQYMMDEPLPNPSALPLYFLTKTAAEQVRIVLSGEGADELFGGYNYYQEPFDYATYHKLPKFLRKIAAEMAKQLPEMRGKRFLRRGAQEIDERFIRHEYVFNIEERAMALKDAGQLKPPHYGNAALFAEVKDFDDVTQMQYVDMQSWMLYDIILKADRMSMAHSLEVRMPFLDPELLKLALAIPTRYRVSDSQTKIALRHAAARELPKKTAQKKKLGFPVPLNDWLRRDEFHQVVQEKFISDVAHRFFDVTYLLDLLATHKSGKDGGMKKIWSIYCFILWYEEYFINR